MRPLDTTVEADALQREISQRLGDAAPLRLALDMSAAAHVLALARLRHLRPDSSDLDLKKALLRLAFPTGILPQPLQ